MVLNYKKLAAITATAAVIAVLTTSCASEAKQEPEPQEVIVVTVTPPPVIVAVPQEPETAWSEEDVQAIARTLAGECYDDKVTDKRLVCEVILNRVSDSRWGDTITEVLEETGQFNGYWTQSRPVSESDLEIAEQALEDWYANDCEALSDYYFFQAGNNRENEFRTDF